MNKTTLTAVVLLVAALGLIYVEIAERETQLIQSMVRLDKRYIPVLALTSAEKLEPSRKAMAALLPEWERFREGHKGMQKQDSGWQADIERIEQQFLSVQKQLVSGHELIAAHEDLEQVRVILLGLRERNGIDYFVDHLTRFHEPMEQIVLQVKGKAPAQLSDQDVAAIQQQLGIATILWQMVITTPVEKKLYGFSAQKIKQIELLIQEEKAALMQLQGALESGANEKIISAALGVKPAFAQQFKLFGDFDSLQK